MAMLLNLDLSSGISMKSHKDTAWTRHKRGRVGEAGTSPNNSVVQFWCHVKGLRTLASKFFLGHMP